MVEVGRDLKGRETKVRRWMRDRFLQNNFILYIWQLKLFYFYLSVNCLLLIFFCCLICVGFFLLSFVLFVLFFFVCLFFFCYTLPCFLLILGDWACLVICFVVYCYLFILFIYLFFYLHGFSGFIFCKFNCSWHFFTSSDRVPPGELVTRGPRFGDWYRGVVSYTNDDLGKRVGWLRRNDEHGTEETVDDGLGGRCLGAGRCPVAPPPWLVMAGRSGRWCQLLCSFFSYLLKIHGDCWLGAGMNKKKVPCSTVAGLGGELHSAFRNIIPVTTPIELRRLLMLPRRKESGETSPKILLNCWVGVVKIPLCSDGLENGAKCSKIE